LGSPDYMSPEQARGLETIDQRSDVWSFSVVLYETIAGVAPFEAENYNALLRQIVEKEPISLQDQCATDAELSQLVACGLSKEPAQRFASMGLMGKAMAAWLSAQGVSEDACGVSLEARWLSRPTDPTSLSRPSRTSSPDSWPEPPSGVRAVSGSLGLAPTVAVARQSVTPYSATRPPVSLSTQKRRLYLGVAGLTILVALLLGWFGATHTDAPREESSAAAAALPAPVAREEPTAVQPPPAPSAATPSPRALPTTPEPVRAPKAAPAASGAATLGKGAAPAIQSKAPAEPDAPPLAPSVPATPKSDLISPY
jgi:serine/threonine protein kinase